MNVIAQIKPFLEQKIESRCSDSYKLLLLITLGHVLEIVPSGINVNLASASGWMSCASTPIDVILCCLLLGHKSFPHLGPDYMANFIPGWDLSPPGRAEISAWLLKQILLKSNCRLHEEGFSAARNSARAKNSSPAFSNWAKIFSPAKQAEKSMQSLSFFSSRVEKGTWTCVSTVFSHLSKLSHGNLHFAPGLKLSIYSQQY